MAKTLKRKLGVGLLTTFGVGVMIGAGIYVLIGVVAGSAGVYAPLVFLAAGLIAAPSALSYAELSTRIPEASGEAAYVEKGLGLHWLAVLTGLSIVVAGTISGAAVLRGGVGYLLAIVDISMVWAIVALGAALTLVALVGVLESMAFAAILTAVELAGLFLVIYAGFSAEAVQDWQVPDKPEFIGIAAAVALAFFAFIGFEDLVNMAEEVKNPETVMPRAILFALAITTVIYALVSVAAVRAVPVSELSASGQPLAAVWRAGMGGNASFLSGIAVMAALNGVLAQIVMAARVLFGLGRRDRWLGPFYHSHARFGTPVLATFLVGSALVAAAISLPVATLAEFAALVLLVVFCVINTALIALKRKVPESPFRTPALVPWFGLIAALGALGLAVWGRI